MDIQVLRENINKACHLGMPLTLEIKDIAEFSEETAKMVFDWLSEIVGRTKREYSVHRSGSGIKFLPFDDDTPRIGFFIDYWWSRSGCWTGWQDKMEGDVKREENLEKVNKVVEEYIKYAEKKAECRKTSKVDEDLLKRLIKDNDYLLKNPERRSAKGYAEINFGKLNREKEGTERTAIIARYQDGSYHQRILVDLSNNGDYYINVATPLCGEYNVGGLWCYELLSKAVNEAFRFITCAD